MESALTAAWPVSSLVDLLFPQLFHRVQLAPAFPIAALVLSGLNPLLVPAACGELASRRVFPGARVEPQK
jgi:hypothetical protein